MLQPLALLPRLAQGDVTPHMAEVLPQIDELKSDLHRFHVEHSAILSMIKQLVMVAREEGKSKHVRFAERLLLRAWLDESVFSPLAILMGEYLELRLHYKHPPPPAASAASRPSKKLDLRVLHLSHAQLSAALANVSHAGDRARTVAETIAKILEPHLEREEEGVLRILGLLAPLVADEFDVEWIEDVSEWGDLEAKESALNLERRALLAAGEELLAIARTDGDDEMREFAERLILRIRLDEEVFYPAALLIRNYFYLRLQPRTRR